jgi:hypothetical protein
MKIHAKTRKIFRGLGEDDSWKQQPLAKNLVALPSILKMSFPKVKREFMSTIGTRVQPAAQQGN